MSEYWKSVPRKFCDFCKCWITDNKPSVEFHERGKRHKENVELKLKEIRKKSLQNSLQEDEVKAQMDKMEKAALEAFKKDLKDNPELAAKYGVSLEPKPTPAAAAKTSVNKEGSTSTNDKEDEDQKDEVQEEWYEAESAEGYHYYWSSITGESRWEPPDKYVSLQEQAARKEDTDQGSSSTTDGKSGTDQQTTSHTDTPAESEACDEAAARIDAGSNHLVYGAWQVVKETQQATIFDETSAPPVLNDIPLPEDSKQGDITHKTREPKFKEKIVTSLGPSSGEPVAFKKRKIASGARNVRQKNDND